MTNKYLIPTLATGSLFFGLDCGASHMELVAPIQEKGNEVIEMISAVFKVIAIISLCIGVVGLATPWITNNKLDFAKKISVIFLAAVFMANLEAVKALIGLN